MKNFKMLTPKTLEEASKMLTGEEGNAVPYAGGTDLLGLMKDGIAAPDRVVNLKSIPGMRDLAYTKGKGLRIGALVTIAEIGEDPVLLEKYTILSEAAREIASPQLRNAGTLGGNLCQRPRCCYFRGDFPCARKGGDLCYAIDGRNKYHCVVGGGPCVIVHPSDMAVALLALDARVTVFSGGEYREMPLSDLYVSPDEDYTREHRLAPGEILTEVRIPGLPAGTESGYLKLKERGSWDFAVVSAGAVVRREEGRFASGRVAFGGVAPVPWRDKGLGTALSGLSTRPEEIARAAGTALEDAQLSS